MQNRPTLAQLSAISAAFLAMPQTADSQIMYHNADPDIELDPVAVAPWYTDMQTYELDINGDAITDFILYNYASASYGGWLGSSYYDNRVRIFPADRQAFAGYDGLGAVDFVSMQNYGAVIDAALNWHEDPVGPGGINGQLFRMNANVVDNFSSGQFGGANGKYIAVRLKFGADKYYGWIRVSVSTNGNEFTMHDYAFNNTPNTAITAGNTGLDCNTPFTLPYQALSPSQVKLKWEAPADVYQYKLRYRAVGAASWINMNIAGTKTAKILSGLSCGVTYEWQIKALCDGGTTNSVFSDLKSFTPAACRLQQSVDEIVTTVDIYPNPATSYIYINADGFDSDALTYAMVDLLGNVVKSGNLIQQETASISVVDLPVGTYIVQVTDGIHIGNTKCVVM